MRALHTLINRTLTLLVLLFSFMASPALLASSITSPTMGSTLDGGAQTITWETGGQTVEQWAIYAGSSVGSFDYFVSGNIGHATSTTVQFLPVNGTAVHIRLWLKIAGVWEIIDASYFASQYTFSLVLGGTLAGANQNLTWTTNGGTITQWALFAGSGSAPYDYYVGGGANASNSVTTVISGLPTDSSVVFLQLWMQVGGYWEKLEVDFTAVAPYSITPVDGSNLTSTSQTFSWNTTGGMIDEWAFYVGSSPGNFDYHIDTGTGLTNSTTATGLPDDASMVYVRIWLKIEGNWEKVDLSYTAFEAELIAITNPMPGNNLDGSSQQFIWDLQGQTIDSWVLYLGSSLGAFDYHVSSGTGTTTSSVATGLPTDNSMVYARLWYQISGESFLRKIDASYNAAPIDTNWDVTLGGSIVDEFTAIIFDQGTSSLYTVGRKGSDAIFVNLELDSTVNFEQIFGGSSTDRFYDIVSDNNGAYYAVGDTSSNNGDITDGNNGGFDALLVKLDKDGTVIWHRTIGGSLNERFSGVTVDSTGSIYAVGQSDSSNADITDGNNGATDALLVKFDSNGIKLWDRTIGGSDSDIFKKVAVDSNGFVYAVGHTLSNNGDITDGNNGAADGLLVTFDSSGNTQWNKTLGGTSVDEFWDIFIDSNGSIYTAGLTISNDGDITDGNNGDYDALLMKLNSSGNKLWDKTLGGLGIDFFYNIAFDPNDGNIYAAGSTPSSNADITDGNNGQVDALLMKFNNNGNKLWDKTVGGSLVDAFNDLALDNGGNIYAAGHSRSTDGDITDGNAGSADGLIFSFSE